MGFSLQDRARIEAVHLCGPKTADYLEMIGYTRFDSLSKADADKLRMAINSHLGKPHINAMGVRAFNNLIEAAKIYKANTQKTRAIPSNHPRSL